MRQGVSSDRWMSVYPSNLISMYWPQAVECSTAFNLVVVSEGVYNVSMSSVCINNTIVQPFIYIYIWVNLNMPYIRMKKAILSNNSDKHLCHGIYLLNGTRNWSNIIPLTNKSVWHILDWLTANQRRITRCNNKCGWILVMTKHKFLHVSFILQ